MSEKLFAETYYDPKKPGSYSGLVGFKKANDKFDKKEVKEWMLDQETYTLHKPLRKKFKRNRIIVYGINNTWQADLVDLRDLSKINNGYKYILTVVDVFSKRAWAIPLVDKTNKSVINAFKNIFNSDKPLRIHTDQGQEFLGKECEKFFKQNHIKLYYLNSEMKASIVERFNRTLKERMWRYFTKSHKKKYIDVLEDLVSSYNNTYHRSIKMKPSQVNSRNENKVFLNLYGARKDLSVVNPKFKVGDTVRLSKNKWHFEKGYTPNWTDEIFTVIEVINLDIPVYRVKDLQDEEIKGVFYEQELQKIKKSDDVYQVEKIIKTRKNRQGKIEHFVKWLGWPDKFNSWIPAENIEQ
jgi:hypothetical protein